MSGNAYEDYYADFSTAYWRDGDPEKCKCRGNGWALSELDTWHQCPCHFSGQKHPDDDSEDDVYGYSDDWSEAFLEQQLDPFRMVCLIGTYDVCLCMALWEANIALAAKWAGDDVDNIPF